jgi:hypothetical protein
MERDREGGGLGRTLARVTERIGQLFGRPRPVHPTAPAGDSREDEVRRELRETYDNPTDAIRARSGFRQ